MGPTATFENPVEQYLRRDRMPHIWCPGCGIGTTVNCFSRAIEQCGVDPDKLREGIDEYYTDRGLDLATGIPKRSTLEALDLEDVADDLESKYGITVPA